MGPGASDLPFVRAKVSLHWTYANLVELTGGPIRALQAAFEFDQIPTRAQDSVS